MINDCKILAIIPARGGSKELPQKNILPLCGKPVIAYSICASLNSKYIDKTIVSTDDSLISEVSRKWGAETPFIRPAELATDTASSVDVIKHALQFINKDQKFDYFIVLQPTSPLRTTEHIDRAIEKYFSTKKSNSETLISVTKMPEKLGWILRANSQGHLKFLLNEKNVPLRRQDLPPLYIPNGALYMASVENFETFYNNETLYFQMTEKESIDLDTAEDLIQIEIVLRAGQNQQSIRPYA